MARLWNAALLAGLALLASAAPVPALDLAGLTHLDGTEVGSADLPDDAVVVFFASWSPRCRGIVDRYQAIAGRWGEVAPVFLVNFQEGPSEVEAFLEGRVEQQRVFLDQRAVFSKAAGITSLPGLLAIKDGTPAFRGKLPADVDSVLRPIFD